MGRPSKTQVLRVWMNGFSVGNWKVGANGANDFVYDKSWLSQTEARPISLSMPLRSEPYRDDRVRAFFDNLLPDTDQIRQRIQANFGTSSTSPFDLLTEIGRDCVGAIQLLPDGDDPSDIRTIKGTPVNNEEIEQLLSNAISFGRQTKNDEDFRISIAGAQEKTALLKHQGQWLKPHNATPTTHIFKLPIGQPGQLGIDLSTSVENEWLCEQILRRYGIESSNSEMMQFGKKKVLVVERFDRRISKDGSWILRLPQEDFCQATGTPSGKKYESDGGPGISKIMSILLGSKNAEQDRLNFFKTQVVFWMLCAIDGHAKNFSLFIESGGSYRMTPRYDVLSAYPVLGHGANMLSPNKVKMAMAFTGKNRHYHWEGILTRHLIETGLQCGLIEDCATVIQDLAEATPDVISHIENIIPDGFPGSVAQPILSGLEAAANKLS
ncbi:MAG: type II toxin-antitoxin system HipA family toxin [Methylotenera sp.]